MITDRVTIRAARLISFLILASVARIAYVAGEDFRIDNRVFATGQSRPDSESTTIFYGGLVYDFLAEPAEVVVFDKAGNRFVLLDLRRRVQTELTAEAVATFVAQIKEKTSGSSNPMVKFLGDPKFSEKFDQASSELTLESVWMTYRVQLLPTSTTIAQQVRDFSDWSARVNAVLNPRSRPPFARLLVNDALAQRQAAAREVRLTLPAKKGAPSNRTTIRSQHELTLQLSPEDVNRVAKVRESMRTFESVAFEKYRKVAER